MKTAVSLWCQKNNNSNNKRGGNTVNSAKRKMNIWYFIDAENKFLEAIEKCAESRGADVVKVVEFARKYANQVHLFPESKRNTEVIGLTTEEMIETFKELTRLLSNDLTQQDAIEFIAGNKWLRKIRPFCYNWK